MSNKKLKQHSTKTNHSSSLKGTLLFTIFLGLFIVLSWSAIFFLFLNRL